MADAQPSVKSPRVDLVDSAQDTRWLNLLREGAVG
jgi:hypothetical protein